MCVWLFLREKDVLIFFSHLICSSALLNKAKKLSLKTSLSQLSSLFVCLFSLIKILRQSKADLI